MTSWKAKQALGLCARRRCELAVVDGSDYCQAHGDQHRRHNVNYMVRKRAEWTRRKRCVTCGRERRPGYTKCPRCLVAQGKISSRGVDSGVDNRQARIAARLIPWKDSPTNANRVRLRGGGRGRRPVLADDKVDLAEAERSLVQGKAGVAWYWSDEVKAMSKIQRTEVREAALDHLRRCKRWIDEVLIRNGALERTPESDE